MKKIKVNSIDIIPVLILVILVVIFAILSGGLSLSSYNIGKLIIQLVPIMLGSLGVIFVVSLGSTDISIGANAAMAATLAAMVTLKTGQSLIFFPLTVVISSLIGLLIGTIATKFKVGTFILTLAMLIGCRGFLNYVVSSVKITTPKGLKLLATTPFALAVLIVSIAIVYYVFEKTKFGYYCKCVGENERTIRSVGINVDKIRVTCFVISGFFAGVVGVTQLCRVGGATNTLCNMLEMRVQMAIFLGGILTTGGFSAKLYKAIIGSITITIIENGLTICGASSQVSEAVEGILLVAILVITIYFNRVAEKKVEQEVVEELISM